MTALAPLRELPRNLQAEQRLLGALLADNRAYDSIVDFLRADHFAEPRHARLYAAISRRLDGGELADAVTLARELPEEERARGGVAYLAELVAAMVSPRMAREYATVVRDAWHRRRLIEIADALRERAFAPGEDAALRIQEDAESELFELAERAEPDAGTPAHIAMGAAIEAAAKAALSPGGLVGLATGLDAIDGITGGLRRGSYFLLAARPSMGKTSLALRIAAGAAERRARVLFISREMSAVAIGAKLAAGLAAVEASAADRGVVHVRDDDGRFRAAPIGPAEINAMVAAQRAMASRTLIIDECRPATLAAVRARARREIRRGGLDLVIIDYLGLMRVPELARSDNRTLEVSRLSAECKAMAVDLDIPVIVLSQLNRGPEAREDKRPTLADLRDSGALEQDADVVAFLYREHYYLVRRAPVRREGESDEKLDARLNAWRDAMRESHGRAELIFAKQRTGPVGPRALAFDQTSIWFGNLPGDET